MDICGRRIKLSVGRVQNAKGLDVGILHIILGYTIYILGKGTVLASRGLCVFPHSWVWHRRGISQDGWQKKPGLSLSFEVCSRSSDQATLIVAKLVEVHFKAGPSYL